MKLCPYNRSREEQYVKQVSKNDDSGNQEGYEYRQVTAFFLMACYEEQCGAWRDGKCCYGENA